jgi:hypothetical protein
LRPSSYAWRCRCRFKYLLALLATEEIGRRQCEHFGTSSSSPKIAHNSLCPVSQSLTVFLNSFHWPKTAEWTGTPSERSALVASIPKSAPGDALWPAATQRLRELARPVEDRVCQLSGQRRGALLRNHGFSFVCRQIVAVFPMSVNSANCSLALVTKSPFNSLRKSAYLRQKTKARFGGRIGLILVFQVPHSTELRLCGGGWGIRTPDRTFGPITV